MKNIKIVCVCLLVVGIFYIGCFAHGLGINILEGGIGIKAFYSDKAPMQYAQVKVYSPRDKESLFQEGNTDKNGRFFFMPDMKGMWKVIVDDGMGHKIEKNININKNFQISIIHENKLNKFQRVLLGLSLIFGIFGIYLLIRKPRRS